MFYNINLNSLFIYFIIDVNRLYKTTHFFDKNVSFLQKVDIDISLIYKYQKMQKFLKIFYFQHISTIKQQQTSVLHLQIICYNL